MVESLIKAEDNLNFAAGELREALNKSGRVEGIIILELIGEAAALHRRVNELLYSHIADKAGDL